MRVVITGAAGRIGSQIVEELSGAHELCLIDKSRISRRESIIANLAKHSRQGIWKAWFNLARPWSRAFKDADVVIHLAATPKVSALWEEVLANNIESTWNVLEAAARYRVPRVVFASSNWAVKAAEKKLAPSCYEPDGPKIDSETPALPLTAYGLSKAFGEVAGKMFVEEGRLESFVAVRIGSYHPMPPSKPVVRAHWIGDADIRSLFRRCVEAELKGFHIVYGVSAQETAPYDLSHTRESLSWSPRQLPDAG